MRHLRPTYLCYDGSGTPKEGRRTLRRTTNGLCLLLFSCGLSSVATSYMLKDLLYRTVFHNVLIVSGLSYWYPTLYYLMGSVSFILSFFVPGLLYLRLMDIPINYALPSEKVKVSVWVCLFLAGSGLALLSNLPVNWMSSWLGDLFPSSSSIAGSSFYSVPTTRATIFTTILSLLNTTLLPAFFEEFIFRGVLLGQLRRFGNGFAVFVSAILFGIFHSTLHQVPFAFLVGLVLGYIIVRTNQIWITIAVHFYNNAFACLPDIAKPLMSSSAYNLLYQLVFYGTMVVGALAILFLLWKHRDVLIPRQIAHHRLSLSSRWFAWISAPATWLVVALCCVRIFTDWA